MSATAAARSFLRSTPAAARMASAPKPGSKPAFSPFRVSKQSPLSPRILRSPVKMSYCVETMLPYHTATSSALLNSMLFVSRCSYGWTPEVAFSPFRVSKQSPLSPRILRSPVKMSYCVETMLPYHTATSSALLNSMLFVSRCSYGWTPEGLSLAGRQLVQPNWRAVSD